jgi:hypothetical protein
VSLRSTPGYLLSALWPGSCSGSVPVATTVFVVPVFSGFADAFGEVGVHADVQGFGTEEFLRNDLEFAGWRHTDGFGFHEDPFKMGLRGA